MTYRAGTIGRTGRGNYGHSLEMTWTDLAGVDHVAVADEDPQGREAAARRTGVQAQYADFRDMLARESLDLVSVAPRWIDCHAEMVIACAEAGAQGILCEKPLARSPSEADDMLAACQANGAKITIAHQSRATPPILRAKELFQEGAIGKLLTMRGRGKEDHRGGGEDLMVLGTHFLDLMRFFAGDPLWCFGDVSVDGRPMGPDDVRTGPEGIGPIAGNELLAVYGFSNGVRGTFESYHDQAGGARRMGAEFYGSEGALSIRGSTQREVYIYRYPLWAPGDGYSWERVEVPEWDTIPIEERLVYTNRMLARDLIASIEEDRQPVASGEDGRMALEMILSVYASAISSARVSLPLADRRHPLMSLQPTSRHS